MRNLHIWDYWGLFLKNLRQEQKSSYYFILFMKDLWEKVFSFPLERKVKCIHLGFMFVDISVLLFLLIAVIVLHECKQFTLHPLNPQWLIHASHLFNKVQLFLSLLLLIVDNAAISTTYSEQKRFILTGEIIIRHDLSNNGLLYIAVKSQEADLILSTYSNPK